MFLVTVEKKNQQKSPSTAFWMMNRFDIQRNCCIEPSNKRRRKHSDFPAYGFNEISEGSV
jgi:hypothetical protein